MLVDACRNRWRDAQEPSASAFETFKFKCVFDTCGVKYSTVSQLKTHLLHYHKDSMKNCIYSGCTYSTSNRFTLKVIYSYCAFVSFQNKARIQCCGSGIRCLFDPWIRDPELVFSGSRIPNPYFWELRDNFLGKKFLNSLKISPIFFSSTFQKLNSSILWNLWLQKKGMTTNFFGYGIRDPGSGKGKNPDPG